jgi:GntR family transcriptional regulator
MPINTADPRPAYQQIADALRTAILRGDLKPGDRLPSHRKLAKEHELAPMTVRQAINLLQTEGFVDTRQGHGAFVRTRPVLRRLGSDRYALRRRRGGQTPFMADTASVGAPTFEPTRFGPVPADQVVAQRLGLSRGELVLVQGLRFHAGGQVMQISTAYIAYDLVQGSAVADPAGKPWETDTITNLEGVGVHVDEVSEDIVCHLPLPEEATALRVRSWMPIFALVRTMFASGRPVETCDILMPTDRYVLSYRFPVPD